MNSFMLTTKNYFEYLLLLSMTASVLAMFLTLILVPIYILSWPQFLIVQGLTQTSFILTCFLGTTALYGSTILCALACGIIYGMYLYHKLMKLLSNQYNHLLSVDDYFLGSLSLYADFGFFILVLIFTMVGLVERSF